MTLRDAVSAVFSVGVLAVCGSTRGGKCTHGATRTRCGGRAHLNMRDPYIFTVMVTSRAGSTVRGVGSASAL